MQRQRASANPRGNCSRALPSTTVRLRPTAKWENGMAQSLAKVYLHVIFSTKNRAPDLADDWRDELFHVLGGTANNLDCQSLTVGGVADHVHLLFQLGRTISIAEAVGKIKSTSSLWVNQTRGLP